MAIDLARAVITAGNRPFDAMMAIYCHLVLFETAPAKYRTDMFYYGAGYATCDVLLGDLVVPKPLKGKPFDMSSYFPD